jgi:hypothetical protein
MRNINLIILTSLFIIFLNSCRTKQFVTQTLTTTVRDTVRDLRTIEIIKPIHDTLTIENPCDSLGLKDFYYKSNLPHGKVIIRSLRGKIQATINMDSVANVYDSKYKSKYSSEVKFFEKIVVKNVVPTWAIVTIFLESLIIIGYIYFRFINPFK